MPWFLVGDQMHSSPMLRKVAAIEPAAVGLWTVAGSWSSGHLTDGFVSDDDLPWLFPDALKLAQALVTAGAWKRVRNGYCFVPDEVTHKIPTKESVQSGREGAAERQRRSRERRSSQGESRVTDNVTNGVTGHTQSNPSQSNPSQSLTDLINQAAGRYALAPDDDPILRSVIDSIHHRTQRVLSAAGARTVAAAIVGNRTVNDPAAYIAKAIAAEKDPIGRWLTSEPELPPEMPAWCEKCDERTRLREDDDGKPARCAECHPLTRQEAS